MKVEPYPKQKWDYLYTVLFWAKRWSLFKPLMNRACAFLSWGQRYRNFDHQARTTWLRAADQTGSCHLLEFCLLSAWFQFCAGWLGCCCFSEICRGFSRKKKLFKKINKSLINFAWPVTIKTCQVIHLKKRPVIYEKKLVTCGLLKKTTYTHLHKENFFSAALIYIKKRKLIDWREILRVSFGQKS